ALTKPVHREDPPRPGGPASPPTGRPSPRRLGDELSVQEELRRFKAGRRRLPPVLLALLEIHGEHQMNPRRRLVDRRRCLALLPPPRGRGRLRPKRITPDPVLAASRAVIGPGARTPPEPRLLQAEDLHRLTVRHARPQPGDAGRHAAK